MKVDKSISKYAVFFLALSLTLPTILGVNKVNVLADEPEYVDVCVSRLTEQDEIVISNESWLESDVEDFEDDIATAQNTTNVTVALRQTLLVYQEYGIIPENETLESIWDILEDLYYENEEDIEYYRSQYGYEEYDEIYLTHVDATVVGGFNCICFKPIYYSINAPNGISIHYLSWSNEEGSINGIDDPAVMELIVFIGLWFLPIHNGYNHVTKWCYGFTYNLFYIIPYET